MWRSTNRGIIVQTGMVIKLDPTSKITRAKGIGIGT
jgi:hypothetical protein